MSLSVPYSLYAMHRCLAALAALTLAAADRAPYARTADLWLPPAILGAAPPAVRPRRLAFRDASSEGLDAREAAADDAAAAAAAAAAGAADAAAAAAGADDETSPYRFPKLITSSQEAQFFDVRTTNPGARALAALPAAHAPLALLPFPPGLPSLGAYRAAEKSATFRAMERWAAGWGAANAAALAAYPFHKDPLHAWSRRYEYVWAAEALRASVAASRAHPRLAALLEGSWPDAPAAPPPPGEPPFAVLELGAQFTFFPQFIASRAGAAVLATDAADFSAQYEAQAPLPLAGEPEGSAARVAFTPGGAFGAGSALAGVGDASIDVVLWVGKLEAAQAALDLAPVAAHVARILKPGGRLLVTFNVGQPPIALDTRATAHVLGVLRGALVEDVTHGAPEELLAGGQARALFTNHKARPAEFPTSTFSISAHVFVKV
jgi:SAM-dependent methyltransferase